MSRASARQPTKEPEEPRPEVISAIVDAYIVAVEALPVPSQQVANRVLQEHILGNVVLEFHQKELATDEELALGRLSVEELYAESPAAYRRRALAGKPKATTSPAAPRPGYFDKDAGGGFRIIRKDIGDN